MSFVTADRRWPGETVVCAATGPSLTPEVAEHCRGVRTIAVSDAYKLFPDADVLYSADEAWWKVHNGVPGFAGEKWSTANGTGRSGDAVAREYGLKIIAGKANINTFSTRPDLIHFGRSSGFQAINLAILFGATRVILCGYNMQFVNGREHFFGRHVSPLQNTDPRRFVIAFDQAARQMPPGVEIINATPDSALRCFKRMELREALALPTLCELETAHVS